MLLLLAIILFIFIILYHIIDYGYHKYYVGKREELQKTWYYKAYQLKDVRSTLEMLTMCNIVGIGVILLVTMFFWSPHIDEKIALYQEENIIIEEQIAGIVNKYQEYELNVINQCSPDEAVTMISLYPELKSDAIVSKQIDVYVANNEKIKSLKVDKINQKLIGWWLNFNWF